MAQSGLVGWSQTPPLSVGAFNAQIIGLKKVKSLENLNVLVRIICQFDILSITEVRDLTQSSVLLLQDHVNLKCPSYGIRISPRSGSTDSQEQIVFFFKLSSVKPIRTLNLHVDQLERATFSVVFQSIRDPSFKFFYMAVHVRPSNVVQELNALVPLFSSAIRKFKTEISSAFIMGDLK